MHENARKAATLGILASALIAAGGNAMPVRKAAPVPRPAPRPQGPAAPQVPARQQCMSHMVSEGNFFRGREYKTWAEYPGVGTNDAYTRAYRDVVKQGFKVASSDREAGVISSLQNVIGSNKTIPVNVTVEPSGRGAKVTVTVQITGGLSVGDDGLNASVCGILDAVSH